MVPGASAPVTPDELLGTYAVLMILFMLITIIYIGKTIYDIIRRTKNETPQIICNLKTILIFILITVIIILLPSDRGTTLLDALFK